MARGHPLRPSRLASLLLSAVLSLPVHSLAENLPAASQGRERKPAPHAGWSTQAPLTWLPPPPPPLLGAELWALRATFPPASLLPGQGWVRLDCANEPSQALALSDSKPVLFSGRRTQVSQLLAEPEGSAHTRHRGPGVWLLRVPRPGQKWEGEVTNHIPVPQEVTWPCLTSKGGVPGPARAGDGAGPGTQHVLSMAGL